MSQKQLTLGKRVLSYTLVFSERKSLTIRMTERGEIEVRAPKRMKESEIEDFLLEKEKWIEKHIELAEARKKRPLPFMWKNGETIPISGQDYQLVVQKDATSKHDIVQLQGQTIVVTTPNDTEPNIREMVAYWFKKACKPIIEQRTYYFAQKMGVTYQRITIKEQKTCWGSCSNRKNLNFNWKLLLMPPEIMDYVIVHELSHLQEMNHSVLFWKKVERILPDYKSRRKWLRDFGSLYTEL